MTASLAACNEAGSAADGSGDQAAPPPPAVAVLEVEAERIPILNELPGRIAPTRIAEVRPQVTGIVEARVFTQGTEVEEGDVLYRIDPKPFAVRVSSAQATLERARSVELQARQEADRQETLRQRNTSSAKQYETAIAQLAQAEADVAIARAALDEAELQLDYAEVKAPISGRIGRARISEGALVSQSIEGGLATIQQLDPVYADFTQPARELLRLRQALEAGELTEVAPGEARVYLKYDDGTDYQQAGRLLFQEATVDATTGQVTLRAEFPNPDGDLLPGMYVRVLIEQGVQEAAIAIPKQSVQRDSSGAASVLTVTSDDTAEAQPVRLGRSLGNRWVVEGGLQPGQRIIVEGFQKVQPGAPVTPEAWTSARAETGENE